MSEIETLLTAKQALDAATDALNVRIAAFEQDLAKLSMGVRVWVKTSDRTYVGYARHQGKWRLLVRWQDAGDPEERCLPLAEGPRELRLHGYKHLPELLPAIEAAAKELTARMERVLATEGKIQP